MEKPNLKDIKLTLRSMLTLGSLIGFLVSWVALAHAARKPVQSNDQSADPPTPVPLPTLAPLPTLMGVTQANAQPASGGNLNIVAPTPAPMPTPIPLPTAMITASRHHKSIFTTGGS